jgi:Ca2+-binding EF-hand superfamily protein
MKALIPAMALAIGLAAAGATAAQTSGTDGKPVPRQTGMIKAMDSDGDGKVSKAEFMAFQPRGRAATAPDAKVTREEFMQRRPHRAAMTPEIKAKMDERRAEAFKAIDKDADGSISREEFMSMPGMMMGRGGAHRHEIRGDRQEMREKMDSRRTEAFQRMDANKDGVIDGAERAASREAAFARMDRNSDGFITADELPRRGHRGHRGPR